MRQGGRIVSVAVTIAVGVNMDGRCKVPGMAIGASEAEPFRTEFPRELVRRGLGVTSRVVVQLAVAIGLLGRVGLRTPG